MYIIYLLSYDILMNTKYYSTAHLFFFISKFDGPILSVSAYTAQSSEVCRPAASGCAQIQPHYFYSAFIYPG